MTDDEVAALGGAGWFVREGFASAAASSEAVRDGAMRWRAAGVSREGVVDGSVRGDELSWVEPDSVPFLALYAAFEALRLEVNRDCWLGLQRFELQLARYGGGGAHYDRHRDALAGARGRRLTAICYLNPAWVEAHGGRLRLWVDPPRELAPRMGRLVVFLSEQVEHEVLPTFADRYAATAWYYGG